MNDFEYSIFFDITVLVDYCRIHLPRCDPARIVINSVHDDGGRLDVSFNCWEYLNQVVSQRQKLFKYLLDRATEHLKENDESAATELFTTDVLSYSVLSSEDALPFDLNEKFRPEISKLRDSILEMGLEKFREYLDSELTQFGRAHSRLDRLIDKRYKRGGWDDTMASITLEDYVSEPIQKESLLDAFFWAKTNGNTVVIREGEVAHSQRNELYGRLWTTGDPEFKLYSPEEIADAVDLI